MPCRRKQAVEERKKTQCLPLRSADWLKRLINKV